MNDQDPRSDLPAAGAIAKAGASTAKSYAGLMVLAWLWVLTPFGYGAYQLIKKVTQLFQ
jgi:hypothetical protein